MAARYACCSADIGLTLVDLAGTADAEAPPGDIEALDQENKNKIRTS